MFCCLFPLHCATPGGSPQRKGPTTSVEWSEAGSQAVRLRASQSSTSTLTIGQDTEVESHMDSDSDDSTLSEAPPLIQRRSTLSLSKPAPNQQPLKDWLLPGYDVYVVTLQEVTSKWPLPRNSLACAACMQRMQVPRGMLQLRLAQR